MTIEIESKRGRPSKDKVVKNNYINNKEFLQILIEYKATGNRKLYNKIGEVVLLLAQRYILKPKFVRYSKDRQNEMISNACLMMVTKAVSEFNPEVSVNAFAYFTQTCHHCYLQHIAQEKLRESRYSNISFIDHLEQVDD